MLLSRCTRNFWHNFIVSIPRSLCMLMLRTKYNFYDICYRNSNVTSLNKFYVSIDMHVWARSKVFKFMLRGRERLTTTSFVYFFLQTSYDFTVSILLWLLIRVFLNKLKFSIIMYFYEFRNLKRLLMPMMYNLLNVSLFYFKFESINMLFFLQSNNTIMCKSCITFNGKLSTKIKIFKRKKP